MLGATLILSQIVWAVEQYVMEIKQIVKISFMLYFFIKMTLNNCLYAILQKIIDNQLFLFGYVCKSK